MKGIIRNIGISFLVLVTFVGCASFADYKITPIDRNSDKYLGKIEVSTLESHLFWNRDYTANKDAQKHIAEKLYKEAINKYGEMVEVVNVTTTTQWSPLSLFYYFSVLGFVEKTTATADVIVSDTPLQEIDYVERFVASNRRSISYKNDADDINKKLNNLYKEEADFVEDKIVYESYLNEQHKALDKKTQELNKRENDLNNLDALINNLANQMADSPSTFKFPEGTTDDIKNKVRNRYIIVLNERAEAEKEVKRLEAEKIRIEKKNDLLSNFDDVIGMKAVDVVNILGYNFDVNTSRGKNYLSEQIIYDNLKNGKDYYIYADNGIVTSYQIW